VGIENYSSGQGTGFRGDFWRWKEQLWGERGLADFANHLPSFTII